MFLILKLLFGKNGNFENFLSFAFSNISFENSSPEVLKGVQAQSWSVRDWITCLETVLSLLLLFLMQSWKDSKSHRYYFPVKSGEFVTNIYFHLKNDVTVKLEEF